jgi:glyoxylase-like metal-dependent hydrolase (beta-lactamase superfamily II)
MASRIEVEGFHDDRTGTVSYIASDPLTGQAAAIDPVLDYEPHAGRTTTAQADRLLQRLQAQGLALQWILETHAHADHLSAARYLQERAGGRIAIGERILEVQSTFKRFYNLGPEFAADGSQFDHLFADGECFAIGGVQASALFVPGHTPADMAYRVDDAVFVGDTLFMPDVGTARTDFPGGDARRLYRSVQRLLSLPADTRMFVCHDYPPPSRGPAWETSVAAQRAANIHVHDGVSEDDFVAMRTARDATLDAPALILQSMQVNVRAGRLPPPEDNGVSYLRIPLNALPSPAR